MILFLLSYRSHFLQLVCFAACGGVLIGDLGVVQSPNYPDPYPESTSCYWDIVSTLGTNISITFESPFDIRNSNSQCEETGGDYLMVIKFSFTFFL